MIETFYDLFSVLTIKHGVRVILCYVLVVFLILRSGVDGFGDYG